MFPGIRYDISNYGEKSLGIAFYSRRRVLPICGSGYHPNMLILPLYRGLLKEQSKSLCALTQNSYSNCWAVNKPVFLAGQSFLEIAQSFHRMKNNQIIAHGIL